MIAPNEAPRIRPAFYTTLVPRLRNNSLPARRAWLGVYDLAARCGFDTVFRFDGTGDGRGSSPEQDQAVRDACAAGWEKRGIKTYLYFKGHSHDAQMTRTGYTGKQPQKHAWMDWRESEHVALALDRVLERGSWVGCAGLFMDYLHQPFGRQPGLMFRVMQELNQAGEVARLDMVWSSGRLFDGYPDPDRGEW